MPMLNVCKKFLKTIAAWLTQVQESQAKKESHFSVARDVIRQNRCWIYLQNHFNNIIQITQMICRLLCRWDKMQIPWNLVCPVSIIFHQCLLYQTQCWGRSPICI